MRCLLFSLCVALATALPAVPSGKFTVEPDQVVLNTATNATLEHCMSPLRLIKPECIGPLYLGKEFTPENRVHNLHVYMRDGLGASTGSDLTANVTDLYNFADDLMAFLLPTAHPRERRSLLRTRRQTNATLITPAPPSVSTLPTGPPSGGDFRSLEARVDALEQRLLELVEENMGLRNNQTNLAGVVATLQEFLDHVRAYLPTYPSAVNYMIMVGSIAGAVMSIIGVFAYLPKLWKRWSPCVAKLGKIEQWFDDMKKDFFLCLLDNLAKKERKKRMKKEFHKGNKITYHAIRYGEERTLQKGRIPQCEVCMGDIHNLPPNAMPLTIIAEVKNQNGMPFCSGIRDAEDETRGAIKVCLAVAYVENGSWSLMRDAMQAYNYATTGSAPAAALANYPGFKPQLVDGVYTQFGLPEMLGHVEAAARQANISITITLLPGSGAGTWGREKLTAVPREGITPLGIIPEQDIAGVIFARSHGIKQGTCTYYAVKGQTSHDAESMDELWATYRQRLVVQDQGHRTPAGMFSGGQEQAAPVPAITFIKQRGASPASLLKRQYQAHQAGAEAAKVESMHQILDYLSVLEMSAVVEESSRRRLAKMKKEVEKKLAETQTNFIVKKSDLESRGGTLDPVEAGGQPLKVISPADALKGKLKAPGITTPGMLSAAAGVPPATSFVEGTYDVTRRAAATQGLHPSGIQPRSPFFPGDNSYI